MSISEAEVDAILEASQCEMNRLEQELARVKQEKNQPDGEILRGLRERIAHLEAELAEKTELTRQKEPTQDPCLPSLCETIKSTSDQKQLAQLVAAWNVMVAEQNRIADPAHRVAALQAESQMNLEKQLDEARAQVKQYKALIHGFDLELSIEKNANADLLEGRVDLEKQLADGQVQINDLTRRLSIEQKANADWRFEKQERSALFAKHCTRDPVELYQEIEALRGLADKRANKIHVLLDADSQLRGSKIREAIIRAWNSQSSQSLTSLRQVVQVAPKDALFKIMDTLELALDSDSESESD